MLGAHTDFSFELEVGGWSPSFFCALDALAHLEPTSRRGTRTGPSCPAPWSGTRLRPNFTTHPAVCRIQRVADLSAQTGLTLGAVKPVRAGGKLGPSRLGSFELLEAHRLGGTHVPMYG
jgi:hypothetical protein